MKIKIAFAVTGAMLLANSAQAQTDAELARWAHCRAIATTLNEHWEAIDKQYKELAATAGEQPSVEDKARLEDMEYTKKDIFETVDNIDFLYDTDETVSDDVIALRQVQLEDLMSQAIDTCLTQN